MNAFLLPFDVSCSSDQPLNSVGSCSTYGSKSMCQPSESVVLDKKTSSLSSRRFSHFWDLNLHWSCRVFGNWCGCLPVLSDFDLAFLFPVCQLSWSSVLHSLRRHSRSCLRSCPPLHGCVCWVLGRPLRFAAVLASRSL